MLCLLSCENEENKAQIHTLWSQVSVPLHYSWYFSVYLLLLRKTWILWVFFFVWWISDFYVKKKFLRNTWYAMELFYSHVEYYLDHLCREMLSWNLIHTFFMGLLHKQVKKIHTERHLWLPWLHCQTVCGKVINYNFFEFALSVKTIFLNRYLYKC